MPRRPYESIVGLPMRRVTLKQGECFQISDFIEAPHYRSGTNGLRIIEEAERACRAKPSIVRTGRGTDRDAAAEPISARISTAG